MSLTLEIPVPDDLEDGCYTICLFRETCTNDELSPDPNFNSTAEWLIGSPALSVLGGLASGTCGVGEYIALGFPEVLKEGCGYTLELETILTDFAGTVLVSTGINGTGQILGSIDADNGNLLVAFTVTAGTDIWLTASEDGGNISIDRFSLICNSCFEQVLCSETINVEDHCHTNLVRYRNNEDSMGFTYPSGFYVQGRAPFRLHKPQFLTTQETYRQSDGVLQLVSGWMDEERELQTDWIPAELHERLRVALLHDIFEVWDEKTASWVGWQAQQDYKIDHQQNYLYAKGTGKVRRTTYDMTNPNCHTEI